ncbi:hypothetical protein KCP91_09360 [Microvirga sp. SRT01]|uniref:Uncharacterized protein n=1 Tax=Sphingomonas longa TaxID=2778730 RepID=A0ABS2D6N6_9SPHN|nr:MULTISPECIES: hypothetical protein [Alphaproteobacteria]MBM6576580.1 hypothetical protein [Sphingomonas sp. BT552]MBR7709626.1 hypothetical protein [Microvirga sp. SRT01]
MTLLAALQCDLIGPGGMLDQPFNGQNCCDYVEQRLVPTLSPGDIVIMDNPGRRRRPVVRRAIRRTRSQAAVPAALIARPHPNGTVPAKLQHRMRKAAERSH